MLSAPMPGLRLGGPSPGYQEASSHLHAGAPFPGAPSQLEQFCPAGNGMQACGVAARHDRAKERRAIGTGQVRRTRSGSLDHAEAVALAVHAEYTENPELAALVMVHECAVERLVRLALQHFTPDTPLRELDVERRDDLAVGLRWCRAEKCFELLGGDAGIRLARVPEEIGVVDEGNQLIDGFADALGRTQVANQLHCFGAYQECVAVARVAAVTGQLFLERREALFRERIERQVEGGWARHTSKVIRPGLHGSLGRKPSRIWRKASGRST